MADDRVTFQEGQVLAVAHEQLFPRHYVDLDHDFKGKMWRFVCIGKDCDWQQIIKGDLP